MRNKKVKKIIRALVKTLDLNAKQILGLQVAGGFIAIAGIIKLVNWIVSLNLDVMFTFCVIGIGFTTGVMVLIMTLAKILDADI